MKDQNKNRIMNHFKSYLILVILLISGYQSYAHPIYGTITNFEILPEYLNANGKIKINSSTPTTQVKYKVTILRSASSTYPTLVWNNTNLTFGLSTGNSSNEPIYVSGTRQVINSDFPNQNIAVLQDLIVTANISRASLVAGHNIILGFKTPEDWTIQSYNGGQYGYELFTPPLSLTNGNWVRDGVTTAIYLYMEGKLRHIAHAETLFGIFDYSDNLLIYSNTTAMSHLTYGNPIGMDSGIIHDVLTDKLYFREGNVLRHIVYWDIFVKYKFKLSAKVDVSDIGGYVIGSAITN